MNLTNSKFSTLLLSWYDLNARDLPWRQNPTPYRVWISEMMLQQTQVETVIPYFNRFVGELPDVRSLAEAAEERVLTLWAGMGYYARARNLHRAAKIIASDYNGEIPASYTALRSLPGLGEYAAGAVASIAFNIRAVAIDGNVLRVMARIMALKQNVILPAVRRRIKNYTEHAMPDDRPGDFNQALMELGAVVCLPNNSPKCEICPLLNLCEGKRLNIAEKLPVKAEKPKRKLQQHTVFLIEIDDKTAILKRTPTGLLADTWELPNVRGHLSAVQAEEQLKSWCVTSKSMCEKGQMRHLFTHIEWDLKVFRVEAFDTPLPEGWVLTANPLRDAALSSAFAKIIKAHKK